MIIAIVAFLWWVGGVTGFIYVWTEANDFTTEEILPAVGIGFIGPCIWLFVGSRKVIFKQRDKNDK